MSGLRALGERGGYVPAGALEALSDGEGWAAQRDAIDAALARGVLARGVTDRLRIWAREFDVSGCDDRPASELWADLRPLIEREAAGASVDWSSPAMLAALRGVQ